MICSNINGQRLKQVAYASARSGEKRSVIHLLLCCVLILATGWTLTVNAQTNESKTSEDLANMDLDKLMNTEFKVTGASRYEQKTTEAPASVSVITADEIKRYGYRTLGDVLQSVQGFYVSYDRNYAFLGARGVNLGDYNSRILLLIDGHRLNGNLSDGAFIDTAFLLDVDLIDRVEIIRGAGSVLYGNNAFFGVINVITRKGDQINWAEVSGDYAQWDSYKGRITLGKRFTNGVSILLSGSYYDADGPNRLFYPEFNTPAQNNGIAQNMDGDSYGSFFGSVNYKDVTLQGGYIRREKVNPTAQFVGALGFNDPRLRTIDERAYASLKYAHSFSNIFDLTAQAYYDRNDFDIGYPSGPTLFKEHAQGEWWGLDLQLTKHLWERHVITVGAEYRDDFHQERHIFDANTGTTVQDTKLDRLSYGFYAQGDFAIVTNLHLNAGVRRDKYGDFDADINPRVALIYNPWESSTFKAIYGTAFRTPNFLELSLGTPGLKPENITSYELVYEQKIDRNLRSSVSAFYNQMDDLIFLQNGTLQNINAETVGAEFAVEGYWTNLLRARLSYSLQSTRNRSGDLDLPDSPNHLAKLAVSVPIYRDKLFAGFEVQYISQRDSLHNTTDIFGQPLTVQGAKAGDYPIVNLTLFSQNLLKNLDFSISLYNVFDTRYSDPATRFHVQDTLERDGRSFRIKLTYRF